VFGCNTKLDYKGLSVHVQTQDKGPSAHYIESLIYLSGKLAASRKSFYTHVLGTPGSKTAVRQIMEEQHGTILREIAEGKLDHLLKPDAKPRG
jgi:molybdopterin biosynthesis enzyme MoaB